SHRHCSVELCRETNAGGNSGAVFDLFSADADVVPRVRFHSDLLPQIGAIIDRVWNKAVRKCEVFLRLWVISALNSEIDRFAVLALTFAIDVVKICHLVLVNRRWRQE